VTLELPVGHEIQEYRVQKVLGSGGFGITYLAQDTRLDRLVAIKEFMPETLVVARDGAMRPVFRGEAEQVAYSELLAAFRDEAQNIARCEHPNVVGVHRIFDHDARPYLVMEWVRGSSLQSRIEQNGPLSEPECGALLTGLMDGLAAVHGSGVLHLDIKPSNIMVRADGSPVLIDFGAARRAHRLDRDPSYRVVSEGYSSPEQYDRANTTLGPASDIYALAATGYYAATGQPPAATMERVLAAARNRPDPLQPLGAIIGEAAVSSQFEQALLSGLALDEAARPASVEAWASMFSPQAEPIVAPSRPAIVVERIRPLPIGQRNSTTLIIGGKWSDAPAIRFSRQGPDGAPLVSAAEPALTAHRSGLVAAAATAANRANAWMAQRSRLTVSLAIAAVLAASTAIISLLPEDFRKAPLHAAPQITAVVTEAPRAAAAPVPMPDSVRRCDISMAHPDDPQRPSDVAGIAWSSIDLTAAREALEACSRAVVEDAAGTPRLRFNLARTYHRLAQLRPEDRAIFVRLAVENYAAAAERGHAAAQGNLGQMLYDGSSGTRDLTKAVEWLRKGALGGFPDSYLTLAHAYTTGTGVEADQRTAVCWYSLVVRTSSVEGYRRWAEQERARIAIDPAEKQRYAESTAGPGECLAIGMSGERPLTPRAG
jgi:serine/threonine protein kinase/TPR repeat protein